IRVAYFVWDIRILWDLVFNSGFCAQPVHNKVISGFEYRSLKPPQKDPCRCQDKFARCQLFDQRPRI
ncbi:hypothetical protein PoB_000651400, partial [Plakobranchus ocellatus]